MTVLKKEESTDRDPCSLLALGSRRSLLALMILND
jgi:hypothetical protein